LQAICELYNRPAEIWAYDPSYGARKLRTFHEVSHAVAVGGGGPHAHNHTRHTVGQTVAAGGWNTRQVVVGGGGDHFPGSSTRGIMSSSTERLSSSSSSHAVIRLSFYGGGHYDSLVDAGHPKDVLSFSSSRAPGEVEDINISRAITRKLHREQQWLKASNNYQGNNHNNNNNNNNYQGNNLININNNNNNTTSSNRMSMAKEEEEALLLSAVARQSDMEATEAEAMDLMLQESRSYQLNADHDDLETSLLLSMLPSYSDDDGGLPIDGFNPHHDHLYPHHDWKEDKDSDDPSTALSNGDMQVALDASSSSSLGESASKTVDMGAIDDIIQNVEKQSELEYLDAMILSQLQHGTTNTATTTTTNCIGDDVDVDGGSIEEQLLRQVQLESEKELLEQFDLEISMRHAAESHTVATSSPYEDSLEQALKESLLQHQRTTTSFIATTASSSSSVSSAIHASSRLGDAFLDENSFQTDEEILQMALEQSLQSYSSSLRGQSNNNNNNNNYQGNNNRTNGGIGQEASSGRTYIIPLTSSATGYGDSSVEEMDEELMRAIEESLRR